MVNYPSLSFFEIWILALTFGLCIGSFLNVVIHRLPRMLQNQWQQDLAQGLNDLGHTKVIEEPGNHEIALKLSESLAARGPRYNLIVPRSQCPHCGHQISALENIPILSYVFLRGGCKACRAPIGIRYPLVELLTGILAVACTYRFGFNWFALAAFALCAVLVALTFIDLDTFLLPDNLTLPLLWGGLLVNLYIGLPALKEAVIGAVAGYLLLWSVYWLFKLATGKEGMGYGDFKLLAALGAWLGWMALPQVLLVASLTGVVIGGGSMLLSGKGRQQPIPFGPYLAASGLVTLFAGNLLLA